MGAGKPCSATTLTLPWDTGPPPCRHAHTAPGTASSPPVSSLGGPWGVAQTPNLLSGGLQPPSSLSHPCFLVPACLHPSPPLPVYLCLADVPLPKPCQPLPGRPSFPQDHPTPGRDHSGDGVAEGGLCGVGDTHMGVSFTAARSHRHLPQSQPPCRGDRCWRAPGTDGHSRLRVHQAAGTATLEMASGWLSVSTLTCWKPLHVALCRCLFQSSSVSQNS